VRGEIVCSSYRGCSSDETVVQVASLVPKSLSREYLIIGLLPARASDVNGGINTLIY
jgi:hypothetical protein